LGKLTAGENKTKRRAGVGSISPGLVWGGEGRKLGGRLSVEAGVLPGDLSLGLQCWSPPAVKHPDVHTSGGRQTQNLPCRNQFTAVTASS